MKNLTDFFTSRNLYYAFLHVALVVLAIQVVVLSGQNRELKERKVPARAEQLRMGDTLFLHHLQPVQTGIHLDTTSPRQMIFIMTTTCPFCRETVPVWKELYTKAKLHMPVFAISLDSKDSTIAYVERNSISFPVFVSLDAATFKKMNKIVGVPQTVITQGNGKVEKIWNGRLNEEKMEEAAAAASIGKINHTQ